MGRPLNKKYFGNRNVGTTGTADNGIGGEGVASVTLDTLGSYTTRPTITFPNPALPNGVKATGTVTSEALSATVSAGGSGFAVGDLLNVTTAGGSAIAYVASVDAGNSNAILTVNFTGTGASRGSFTSLGTVTTTVNTSTAGTGTLTLVVTYQAKAVVITEKGSGYTSTLTAGDLTFTQSVTASAVALTTDSGNVGSSTNQENAISMVAFLTGGSAGAVDIIKQVSTRRYKVTDGTRTGIVTLSSTEADAAGEGSILATDASGGTYYVTKLTAHKATLKRGTGTVYTDGAAVPWTFGTATATTCKIANA